MDRKSSIPNVLKQPPIPESSPEWHFSFGKKSAAKETCLFDARFFLFMLNFNPPCRTPRAPAHPWKHGTRRSSSTPQIKMINSVKYGPQKGGPPTHTGNQNSE
jgi:hypothetical protein